MLKQRHKRLAKGGGKWQQVREAQSPWRRLPRRLAGLVFVTKHHTLHTGCSCGGHDGGRRQQWAQKPEGRLMMYQSSKGVLLKRNKNASDKECLSCMWIPFAFLVADDIGEEAGVLKIENGPRFEQPHLLRHLSAIIRRAQPQIKVLLLSIDPSCCARTCNRVSSTVFACIQSINQSIAYRASSAST